jgi:hypothetical protein
MLNYMESMMKTMMNLFALVLFTLSFAACEKTNNPVNPVAADKTSLFDNGTFEVTYKDYQNADRTVTLSGDIDFNLNSDNTYSYTATVSSSSDNENTTTLHDNGVYKIKGDNIEMYDNATKLMNPAWQPSLYLSGTYSYIRNDNQIIIEGSGTNGAVRIVLHN